MIIVAIVGIVCDYNYTLLINEKNKHQRKKRYPVIPLKKLRIALHLLDECLEKVLSIITSFYIDMY